MTQNWSKFVAWDDYALAAVSALFFVSMLGADGSIPAIATVFKIIGYVLIALVVILHFLAMRQFRLASLETTPHYLGFAGAAIALVAFIFTLGWLGLVAAVVLIAAGVYVTVSMRGANLHATSAMKTVEVAAKNKKETKSTSKSSK